MKRIATSLSLAAGLALAGPVRAQEPAPPQKYDPKVAFAETDTNGDGRIDHAELMTRIVDVFYLADTNKDGYLSTEEMTAAVVYQSDFDEADLNHDGKISMPEFEHDRAKQFEAADLNHDGVLTLEEVEVKFRGGSAQ
ncbi:MAG TPA: EF-hand domain-containing protein [Myxococcota bacterium]|jgi:hypothetical protein|nr:EF-hand domain-containing protein [Myxococcota bacterium]